MRLASGTAGPTQSVGDDPVLAQWVEAVKARLEAGEPVDLDDYVRQDPRGPSGCAGSCRPSG